MSFINDIVFDSGLSTITSLGNRCDITSAEAATYTEATSTYTLGNKGSITISSPLNGVTNGRRVTMSAFTGGNVTASGTAAYWAISNSGTSTLLAAGSITNAQVVTSGNTFSLSAIDVTIPDAV